MKHKQTYKTVQIFKKRIPIPSAGCISSGFIKAKNNYDKDEKNQMKEKGIYINLSEKWGYTLMNRVVWLGFQSF